MRRPPDPGADSGAHSRDSSGSSEPFPVLVICDGDSAEHRGRAAYDEIAREWSPLLDLEYHTVRLDRASSPGSDRDDPRRLSQARLVMVVSDHDGYSPGIRDWLKEMMTYRHPDSPGLLVSIEPSKPGAATSAARSLLLRSVADVGHLDFLRVAPKPAVECLRDWLACRPEPIVRPAPPPED